MQIEEGPIYGETRSIEIVERFGTVQASEGGIRSSRHEVQKVM